MSIADKFKEIRRSLIEQADDQIDMGDYRNQIRAYQQIMNDHLKASIELAELCEKLALEMKETDDGNE
jgi:hypothetical protein